MVNAPLEGDHKDHPNIIALASGHESEGCFLPSFETRSRLSFCNNVIDKYKTSSLLFCDLNDVISKEFSQRVSSIATKVNIFS